MQICKYSPSCRFWSGGRVRLWEEKLGLAEKFAGNAATEWGTNLESEALDRYTEVTGHQVQARSFQVYGDSLVTAWLGASPDGLIPTSAAQNLEYTGKPGFIHSWHADGLSCNYGASLWDQQAKGFLMQKRQRPCSSNADWSLSSCGISSKTVSSSYLRIGLALIISNFATDTTILCFQQSLLWTQSRGLCNEVDCIALEWHVGRAKFDSHAGLERPSAYRRPPRGIGPGVLEIKCPHNKGNPLKAKPYPSAPWYYMPQARRLLRSIAFNWASMQGWIMVWIIFTF